MTTTSRHHEKWETRPFECWVKAKELRRKHSQDVIGAHEKRKWICEGSDSVVLAMERIRPVIGPPQVAITANANSKLNREAQAAAECRGFGRVLCGYRRGFYGVQLLNKDLSGGTFPGRDFCLATPASCDDHAKDIGPTRISFTSLAGRGRLHVTPVP